MASAVVKTYDFVVAEESTIVLPTWGTEVTSGGVALNMLAYGDNTFDNRFAVGPTSRNNDSGNCFKFRTAGTWKGLWSQYADRNISVLNLKVGDKVTVTMHAEAAALKVVNGDAVPNGTPIAVEADGNLDLVSTGSVYIESIAIESNDEGGSDEPTTEYEYNTPITYDFVQAPEGSVVLPIWGEEVTSGGVALNMLATNDNDFDNRFAVGPTSRNNDSGNCFKFRTAGTWKGLWSQYSDRNISILDLKQGDKVSFVISKEEQTLKFVGGDVVTSEKEYIVEADGNLDFVTTGSVYIESITITPVKAAEPVPTGINAIGAETLLNGAVYNLNGQRVKSSQKGLYIINGKKVVVK